MKKKTFPLFYALLFLLVTITSCEKDTSDDKYEVNWDSPTDQQLYHFGDTIHVKGSYTIPQMGDWSGTDHLYLELSNGGDTIIGSDGNSGTFDIVYYNNYTDTTEIEMKIYIHGTYGYKDIEMKRKITCLPN